MVAVWDACVAGSSLTYYSVPVPSRLWIDIWLSSLDAGCDGHIPFWSAWVQCLAAAPDSILLICILGDNCDGFLPPTWDIRIEFPALSFDLAQSWSL